MLCCRAVSSRVDYRALSSAVVAQVDISSEDVPLPQGSFVNHVARVVVCFRLLFPVLTLCQH